LGKEEVFRLRNYKVQLFTKKEKETPYVDSPFVSHPSYSLKYPSGQDSFPQAFDEEGKARARSGREGMEGLKVQYGHAQRRKSKLLALGK
jgi:hypothetical protein